MIYWYCKYRATLFLGVAKFEEFQVAKQNRMLDINAVNYQYACIC